MAEPFFIPFSLMRHRSPVSHCIKTVFRFPFHLLFLHRQLHLSSVTALISIDITTKYTLWVQVRPYMHQQYRNDIAHYIFFSDYPYLTFPTLEQVDLSSHRLLRTTVPFLGMCEFYNPFISKILLY